MHNPSDSNEITRKYFDSMYIVTAELCSIMARTRYHTVKEIDDRCIIINR